MTDAEERVLEAQAALETKVTAHCKQILESGMNAAWDGAATLPYGVGDEIIRDIMRDANTLLQAGELAVLEKAHALAHSDPIGRDRPLHSLAECLSTRWRALHAAIERGEFCVQQLADGKEQVVVAEERGGANAQRAALSYWGQEPDTGHLLFVVRVRGLPAMTKSALQVARELCALWEPSLRERFGPLCTVESADDLRAALLAEGGQAGGEKEGDSHA